MQKIIYSNNYKYLLQLLKSYRKKANLTQKELADKLDVNQSLISKIESGERKINLIELIMIFKVMNFNPLEIIEKFLNSWIDE
ncbi:helix-turn-helix transcriptional regulator [bacterium]|nr:helix-turn-helix transcriptional regulator [bacterium]